MNIYNANNEIVKYSIPTVRFLFLAIPKWNCFFPIDHGNLSDGTLHILIKQNYK
jgi:hypothetical protein